MKFAEFQEWLKTSTEPLAEALRALIKIPVETARAAFTKEKDEDVEDDDES